MAGGRSTRPRPMHGGLRPSRSYLSGFGWKGLVKLGPFRWGDAAPRRAARVAIGVMVPLAVGTAGGHPDFGAFAALGALPAGFVALEDVTLSRVAAVAAASIGMAASTFVGATTAATGPWLLVPAVMLWGYVTALAAPLGPRLSVVTLQWAVALLIAIGLPLRPADAALRAGLVVAGGLFQGVLVAGSWALRRGEGERTALATSYRALAGYASDLAAGRFEPPPPIAFPAATALDEPNPLLPVRDRLMLLDLLEEAERLRAALAAVAGQAAGGGPGDAGEAARSLAADAATVLDLIAGALSAGGAERAGRVRDLNRRLAGLTVVANASWRRAGEALLDRLRAVVAILARLDAVPVEAPAGVAAAPSLPVAEGGAAAAVATLRANLGLSSEAGRHALRLAVVGGLAQAIVQATGLNEGRWVTLTIFLVLKPDYSSTLYRGVQRSVGTTLGAGLGAAAAQLGYMGKGGLVAVAGVCIAAAYALFNVSYVLYSMVFTGFIVVILDILGTSAVTTAEARLAATAIGAALALTAYFLWPTWEGSTAHEKFARLVEAHGAYSTALLQQLAHPGRVAPAHLRGLQAAARRARSDAEASTARLADEPSHPPLTPGVARALNAAVSRLANAALALHTLVPLQPVTAGQDDERGPSDATARRLDALAAALDTTMSRLTVSLRTLQPPQSLPALRPCQAALRRQPAPLDATVVRVTDGLVDATNTLAAILRDHLPAVPAAARASGSQTPTEGSAGPPLPS